MPTSDTSVRDQTKENEVKIDTKSTSRGKSTSPTPQRSPTAIVERAKACAEIGVQLVTLVADGMELDTRNMAILASQAQSLRQATEKLDSPDVLAATTKLPSPPPLASNVGASSPHSSTEMELTPQRLEQIQSYVKAHINKEDLDADGDGKMSLEDWNAMYFKMMGEMQPAEQDALQGTSTTVSAVVGSDGPVPTSCEAPSETSEAVQAKEVAAATTVPLSVSEEEEMVRVERRQVFSMAAGAEKEAAKRKLAADEAHLKQSHETQPPREYKSLLPPEQDKSAAETMVWNEQLQLWLPAWYASSTEPVHSDINTEIYKQHWKKPDPPPPSDPEAASDEDIYLARIAGTLGVWQSCLREGDDPPPMEGKRLFLPARPRVPEGHNVMNRLYRDRHNPQPQPKAKQERIQEPVYTQKEASLKANRLP